MEADDPLRRPSKGIEKSKIFNISNLNIFTKYHDLTFINVSTIIKQHSQIIARGYIISCTGERGLYSDLNTKQNFKGTHMAWLAIWSV